MLENNLTTSSINHQTYNSSLINLHKILLKKLFVKNLKSANNKKELEFFIKPKPIYEALHDNFLRFGTKEATSFLIIDIDNVKMGLEEYEQVIYKKLNIKPTWITRTSKGYHIGFILEKAVFSNDKHQTDIFSQTKRYLTELLDADVAGSHRLIGYWRNPLTHKSIINDKSIFTLQTLYKHSLKLLLDKQSLNQDNYSIKNNNISTKPKINLSTKLNVNKIDIKDFKKGSRNSFLFNKGVSLLYSNSINKENLYSTLLNLNNRIKDNLSESEVKRISDSIQKYNINPNQNKKEYKAGEYHQALWDNSIHNYKIENNIEFSRQKMGQKITTAIIIRNTLEKLLEGYTLIYKQNKPFTNKNIVENSKVSKSTVKRYRNKRKVEDEIKLVAFKVFIEDLMQKNVKADEPQWKELINLALSELFFDYPLTQKRFVFEVNEDNKLIFYELGRDIDIAV